jgi:hypothetical protein
VPGSLPGIISVPAGVAIYNRNLYLTSNCAVVIVTNVP